MMLDCTEKHTQFTWYGLVLAVSLGFVIALIAGGIAMGLAHEDDKAYLVEVRAGLPADGVPLLGDTTDLGRLHLTRTSNDLGQMTAVDVEGQGFSSAVRVEVVRDPQTAWDVQVIAPTNEVPIAEGDTLLVTFCARCTTARDETGEGMLKFFLQSVGTPWVGVLGAERRIGKQWQRFYSHVVAQRDWAVGEVNLTLHVSPYVQTIEIGGLAVLNLGQYIDPSELPIDRLTYAGRQLDAPWRTEATERIEKYRKGPLVVQVRDANGKPVPGVPVHVRMTRHAYGFGSLFNYRILDESGQVIDTDDGRHYAEWFLKLFNKATTQMYWADWGWVNPEVRKAYHRNAKWLQEHGIPTRGHVLVWPAWRWLPKAIKELEGRPDTLRSIVRDHVTEVVEAMHPYDLIEYDVMNEPRVNHDLMDILGEEVMLDWFRAAKEADPRQTLYINEYSLLTSSGYTEPEQDAYEKTIRLLLDSGAPLGGIGLQGHMGEGLTPPKRVLEILDRFARFGLPLQVTEFDIEIDDEGVQADYTRDFLTAVFSHPATIGFVQWGFWETLHWKPRGAMFRKDWSTKPNGQAYIDLVLGEWWTDRQGFTNEDGRFTIRGFCGDYEITVGEGDLATQHTIVLSTDGYTLELTLD
jgi:endo-1,4-beta-xylanase